MAKEKEFKFLITTLAGSKFSNFLRLSWKYGIERPYFLKWLLSLIVSAVCTLLALGDRLIFFFKKAPTQTKDPVFILGHWRSGTTHLHQLMCSDPDAAYTTTYQTVFPNNLFAFQWFFKPIMKSMMPDKRPVDNVKLHADFPQEEEFALNNEQPFSFYNWWYFPKRTKEIADQYLLSNSATADEVTGFKKNYKRFVKRCLLNTKGNRFISKNPPHTARVKWLLEMYPNAKFVFIHRNPYEVVQSTLNFYKSILPATQLQGYTEDTLFKNILDVYSKMIEQYYEQKEVLSNKNLMEVSYEELTQNPKSTIKTIYQDLLQEDFTTLASKLDKTIQSKHPLKDYNYKVDYLKLVNNKLGWIIDKQGYERL